MNETPGPTLVGVIDLLGGVAVRAVGGRRDEYRPVAGKLCGSPRPRDVAAAFRDRYGIGTLYVADLDAILGRGRNDAAVRELVADGFRVTLDPGLRSVADFDRLADLGADTLVAALETLPGPDALAAIVERAGSGGLLFGLDLADGVPLADPRAWGADGWNADSPVRLACGAVASGATGVVALDLRRIGTASGAATADLCRRLRGELPGVRLWTGGGVRHAADVQALADAGADGVLVASALHDETL